MTLKIFQWRSIATRVTLLTLTIFIVCVWAITFYVSRVLHEGMLRVLGAQQFSTASYIADAVNDELNDRVNALNAVAEQIKPTVLGNTADLQKLIEQRPILASLFSGSVWVSRQDGIAIASLMPELIGINYADREYLITVLKEGKSAISKPITGKVMKDAIFVMAVPIRDGQGQVIGALAGVTDLGRPNFLDKLTGSRYGQTGSYFIVAPQYRMVITSSDKNRVMQPLPAPGVNPMIDRFVQGYEGYAILVNAVGKEVLSSSKLIPLTGWAVSISLPTAEAFAPIHEMEQRALNISLILTLLTGCLIWLVISKTIQRQLSPMLVASRMLAKMCDTDQPPQLLPVTSQDEIGELIGGFNRLLDTLGKREQALIRSENQLKKTQHIAQIGSWYLDVATNQVLWTEELYKMYGLDPSLPPPSYTEHQRLLTTESWETLSSALAKTRDTGVPYELELATVREDGNNGWMWMRGETVLDGGGKIVGFWGAAQNITERKQTEDTLRESEQSFRTLSNSGMALIWTSGTDKLCNYFNSVWLEFTGRTLEEEMGNGWTEGVHPDDFQRCLDIYVGAFDRQEKFSMEYRLRRHDGEYRWIVDEGCPRYDSYGNFIGYIGHCLDITERKLAEMNYQTLFNEMFDGFALHEIIVDDIGVPVNYRFLAVNPAFERITGLKAADIIGHTVFDIMPDTEMRWIETYGKVALTGDPVHLEDYSTTLQKHFEVTAYRPAPGQFACVIIDVTEKKKAAEEKQKLQVQLQQAQKMEAIGTLAGGIAHDFNNILGAILGYAEMVQEDSPAGSRSRGDIDQVVNASHRAKELVKQILNFSRQAATEQIPLHPALIIKEVVKMLRSSLPSTIDLQQDVDSDVGLILADPTQIHQVLVNLCTNAFHAMEETGGILTISLKKTTLSREDIASEPQVQPGDFVQLSISDTGSGIAPEIQQKMFDPFFTTKEVGKGTGMGLAIIHGIAKSYKGFVNYNSKPGEGTVFRVYLPVIQDPALLDIEPVTFDLPLLGNERILFIDDEEILADVGKAMLERLGYRVTVRRSSIEALNTFQNQPDQFDLVITDQTMPNMTGSDLARRMLQIRPGMPIILCTGYSSVMSEEKACSLGIKGFAFKPLAKNDLASLIRKVFDGEKPTG